MLYRPVEEDQKITLAIYHEEYYEALMRFYLPIHQLRFTALPMNVLQEAITDKNRLPVVILDGNTPVGFFVLQTGEDISVFTSNPYAVLLRAFSVNYPDQRKGHAKRALQLLPQFIFENIHSINEIVLAVNTDNKRAKKLYEKMGYQYQRRIRYGFLRMRSVLQYRLPIGNSKLLVINK